MTQNESDQKKSAEPVQPDDLDYVLNEVGEFRKHQIFHFILIALPIILASTNAVEFIVTSSTSDYRCRIPGCDLTIGNNNYNQSWLQDAIPYKHGRPAKCLRYKSTVNSNYTSLPPISADEQTCPMVTFDRSQVIQCDEFIFKTNEHRVSKEFNIMCEENEYKLALIGTINNIGGFILMPLTGLLSDKFGRLNVLIWSLFGNAVFGLAKGFVGSYTSFLVCEFLGAAIGTSTFMAAFVLCVEWVSTKHRVMSSTIVSLFYPLGEILLGLAAMYYDHYRSFLVFVYTPALLIIFYFWLVPESIRWLVVTGQHKAALKILKRTAKNNNTTISEKSYAILRQSCNASTLALDKIDGEKGQEGNHNESVTEIFKHKVLIIRLIVCSMCWIMVTHIFYGLSLSATKIDDDDNKYLSYIVVMAAELPAALISYFLLDYAGRRTTMCGSLVTAGVATIASTLIPVQQTIIIRMLFFIGMCATSCAFAVLYIYSAEIWPTPLRNTMMNLCSMIGRFGSMLAPLTTLFAQYMPALPFIIFGGTAILSGCIIFILPETLKKKLPDNVEEARNL